MAAVVPRTVAANANPPTLFAQFISFSLVFDPLKIAIETVSL